MMRIQKAPNAPHISEVIKEDKSAAHILRTYWPYYKQYDHNAFTPIQFKLFKSVVLLCRLGHGDALYFGENGQVWQLTNGITVAVVEDPEGYKALQPIFGYEAYFQAIVDDEEVPGD